MNKLLESRGLSTLITLAFFLLIGVAVFIVMKSFIIAMLWGMVLGFSLLPPLSELSTRLEKWGDKYTWTKKIFHKRAKNVTAAGVFTLAFLLVTIFTLFLAKETIGDIQQLYGENLNSVEIETTFLRLGEKGQEIISKVPTFVLSEETKERWIEKLDDSQEMGILVKQGFKDLFQKVFLEKFRPGNLGSFITGFAINFYIFVLFFFGIIFTNPEKAVRNIIQKKTLKNLLGIDLNKLYDDFKNIVELQINVVLENSILQGLIFFIGLVIADVMPFHYAFFLGFLSVFFTLLPAVGVSLVVFPMILYGLLAGYPTLVICMVVVLLLCQVDEWYLRQVYYRPFSGPLMALLGVKRKESENPEHYEIPAVFYLISQIGAVSLFGISGFVFGPIFFMLVKVILRDFLKTVD